MSPLDAKKLKTNIHPDFPGPISGFWVHYTKSRLLKINGMPFAPELLRESLLLPVFVMKGKTSSFSRQTPGHWSLR